MRSWGPDDRRHAYRRARGRDSAVDVAVALDDELPEGGVGIDELPQRRDACGLPEAT
jgi:hypothetical protein